MSTPTFTPAGSVRFEHARADLARLRDVELEAVSDADVVAYLEPGPAARRRRPEGEESHEPD